MEKSSLVISGCLILAALIHTAPLIGVLGEDKLNRLYGISFAQQDLLVLMQHRAVLFGIVAAILYLAAFQPQYSLLGIVVGLASTSSFIVFALMADQINAQIVKIVWADVVALIGLLIAAGLYYLR